MEWEGAAGGGYVSEMEDSRRDAIDGSLATTPESAAIPIDLSIEQPLAALPRGTNLPPSGLIDPVGQLQAANERNANNSELLVSLLHHVAAECKREGENGDTLSAQNARLCDEIIRRKQIGRGDTRVSSDLVVSLCTWISRNAKV